MLLIGPRGQGFSGAAAGGPPGVLPPDTGNEAADPGGVPAVAVAARAQQVRFFDVPHLQLHAAHHHGKAGPGAGG
jgi:hypothetical protein